MTRSESIRFYGHLLKANAFGGVALPRWRRIGQRSRYYPHAVVASAHDAAVTLPMCREAPSNFGVKLSRPAPGPAAELPTSPPA
jgi:hypothetical protein